MLVFVDGKYANTLAPLLIKTEHNGINIPLVGVGVWVGVFVGVWVGVIVGVSDGWGVFVGVIVGVGVGVKQGTTNVQVLL